MTRKKLTILSKLNFAKIIKRIKDSSNIAIISIESSDECAKYWMDESNNHLLPDSDSVLNLNFDDIPRDIVWEDHLFVTINDDQAKKLFEFIESHLGMDFIIHCKAGKSRSQAVGRFIANHYEDYKDNSTLESYNPTVYQKLCDLYNKKYYENLESN